MSDLRLPLTFSVSGHAIAVALLIHLLNHTPPVPEPIVKGGIEVAFAPLPPPKPAPTTTTTFEPELPPKLVEPQTAPEPPPPPPPEPLVVATEPPIPEAAVTAQEPPPPIPEAAVTAQEPPPPIPEAAVTAQEPPPPIPEAAVTAQEPPPPIPEAAVTAQEPPPPPAHKPRVQRPPKPVPQDHETPHPAQAYIPPMPDQPATPQAPPAPIAPPQTAMASTPVPAPAPEAIAGYHALLSAWLETHKRYPETARQRGEEGHAVLRFLVDRSGHVVDYAVISSSGYPDLDQSVEEMMRGATLPPFPAGMTQPRMEVSVTIRFSLRR